MSCVLWWQNSLRQLVNLWKHDTSRQIAELYSSWVTHNWQQSAIFSPGSDLWCADCDSQPHESGKFTIMLIHGVVMLYEVILCVKCKICFAACVVGKSVQLGEQLACHSQKSGADDESMQWKRLLLSSTSKSHPVIWSIWTFLEWAVVLLCELMEGMHFIKYQLLCCVVPEIWQKYNNTQSLQRCWQLCEALLRNSRAWSLMLTMTVLTCWCLTGMIFAMTTILIVLAY